MKTEPSGVEDLETPEGRIARLMEARISAAVAAEREKTQENFLTWRGIEPENTCPKCSGSGVRAYSSTSTWRGGGGGQAITSGPCDSCWGSGDKSRPGPDLRKAASLVSAAVAAEREACAKLFDDSGLAGSWIAKAIRSRGSQKGEPS